MQNINLKLSKVLDPIGKVVQEKIENVLKKYQILKFN
jgi:hypothetical protein